MHRIDYKKGAPNSNDRPAFLWDEALKNAAEEVRIILKEEKEERARDTKK